MEVLRDKGGSDTPGRLPCFFMVTTYAKANLPVGLEATVWSGEAKAWRPERIRWRQDNTAMINTLAVWGIWRASDGEMPFKEIRL